MSAAFREALRHACNSRFYSANSAANFDNRSFCRTCSGFITVRIGGDFCVPLSPITTAHRIDRTNQPRLTINLRVVPIALAATASIGSATNDSSHPIADDADLMKLRTAFGSA